MAHRLAGYIVGCCVIVLAAGLWMTDSRRWLRWLGTATLGGRDCAGLVGRLSRAAQRMARAQIWPLVHGSFAPVVFSLIVSLAVFTGSRWTSASSLPSGHVRCDCSGLRCALVGLVMIQIILGAFLRHTFSTLGQRGHLLVGVRGDGRRGLPRSRSLRACSRATAPCANRRGCFGVPRRACNYP